jgi:hypothetical protein
MVLEPYQNQNFTKYIYVLKFCSFPPPLKQDTNIPLTYQTILFPSKGSSPVYLDAKFYFISRSTFSELNCKRDGSDYYIKRYRLLFRPLSIKWLSLFRWVPQVTCGGSLSCSVCCLYQIIVLLKSDARANQASHCWNCITHRLPHSNPLTNSIYDVASYLQTK